MTYLLFSDTAIGYGLIMGIVILAVLIYSVIRLRKQVKQKKKDEEQKRKGNL